MIKVWAGNIPVAWLGVTLMSWRTDRLRGHQHNGRHRQLDKKPQAKHTDARQCLQKRAARQFARPHWGQDCVNSALQWRQNLA